MGKIKLGLGKSAEIQSWESGHILIIREEGDKITIFGDERLRQLRDFLIAQNLGDKK